jgi:hypothetical protein
LFDDIKITVNPKIKFIKLGYQAGLQKISSINLTDILNDIIKKEEHLLNSKFNLILVNQCKSFY